MSHIKRGEIYWCDLDPTKGSEQKGLRPMLILQNDIGNRFSNTTIGVALTTTITEKDKRYPMNVFVKKDSINKLTDDSLIKTAQIRVLDISSRIKNKIGELDKTTMIKVEKALKINLEMCEKCPSCNTLIAEPVEKCPKCKIKLYIKCKQCENIVDAVWKFCPLCGKEVE